MTIATALLTRKLQLLERLLEEVSLSELDEIERSLVRINALLNRLYAPTTEARATRH